MNRNIENIKELSLIEKIVISNAYEIYLLVEQNKKIALKALKDNDFIRAKVYLEESEYFEHTPEFLRKMQEDVLKYCSVAILKKIINSQTFPTDSILEPNFIIPKEILPKLYSSEKYKKDEKWEIYKALGATITV